MGARFFYGNWIKNQYFKYNFNSKLEESRKYLPGKKNSGINLF